MRFRFATWSKAAVIIGFTCLAAAGLETSWGRENNTVRPGLFGTTHYVSVNGNDDGPGTAVRPWATLNHAAEQAQAGDKIVVRGGHYLLAGQIRVRNSGRHDAWITFTGYPGEHAILDAKMVLRSQLFRPGEFHERYDNGKVLLIDNGVFQIQNVSYIRVTNLSLINCHDAGFTVRDSSYVDLINNATNATYSSGIAVWDTNHQGTATQHIRIIGNTISKPTDVDLAPPGMPRVAGTAPQEALSIAGAVDFDVSDNQVYDSDEGGIDIKETSAHGKVHHNLIHNVGLGIYVDAWFGKLADIEIFANDVHNCAQAGIALAVEQGELVEDIDIHNNVIFNNDGSGLYVPRWGANSERRNIDIHNNTFFHNGYGKPKAGQAYYWITGGLYLHSTHVRDIRISNNIFSDNRGFQIGYSELFLQQGNWSAATAGKNIVITNNLIDGANATDSPIESGGVPTDQVKIYPVSGERAILRDPLFRNSAAHDFRLRRASPAARRHLGAYPLDRSITVGPRR